MRTYKKINSKIEEGKVTVITAEEASKIIKEIGIDKAFEKIDIVTTGAFNAVDSLSVYLNLDSTFTKNRLKNITLNNIPILGNAKDIHINIAEESKDLGYEYGGSHLIYDLVSGKGVNLVASIKGHDKEVNKMIYGSDINKGYLSCFRYSNNNFANINSSDKAIYTSTGVLLPNMECINYSSSGKVGKNILDLIGNGTKILVAGGEGYITVDGNGFNKEIKPKIDFSFVSDLSKVDLKYISPAVYENYGVSMFIGISIPIPILNIDILKMFDKSTDIDIVDYGLEKKPIIKSVKFEELQSGKININGRFVKTAPLSSFKKAKEISTLLKNKILNGEFLLAKPVDSNNKLLSGGKY